MDHDVGKIKLAKGAEVGTIIRIVHTLMYKTRERYNIRDVLICARAFFLFFISLFN